MKNYKRLFWIFNISGWILVYIIYLFTYYSRSLNNFNTIIGVFMIYLTGFITSILLRKIYSKIYKKQRPVVHASILIVIISIIATHIWYIIDVASSCLMFYSWSFINRNIVSVEADIMLRAPLIIAWSGFYYVFRLWNDLVVEKERAAKADLLAHKAQLQMLRYQLNPHFLFNTLNTIRALVEEDKEKAKIIVTELSEFLRYSLINKSSSIVPLSEEIDAIKHYIEIQRKRYEDKLIVQIDIEPGTEKFQIPSFLIYPLIENAIKYGMKTSMLPLNIKINAGMNKNYLFVQVINTGKWFVNSNDTYSLDRGTGKGLENVKLRLENAYGKNQSFNLKEEENKVIAELQIKKPEYEKDF